MDARPAYRYEPFLILVGALVFIALSSVGLDTFPQPWWDEGWTLSVARNWVTAGHYGHMLNGVPAAPSLSAHLPVVALVAAAFVFFGVGLVQARMTMVVCAAVLLVLLYILSRELSSRRTALGALLLVCVFPVQWDLSVLFLARNVLGEVPALMFLVAALVALLASRGTRVPLLGLSAVLFGVALATKAQVVPFVLIGLLGTSVLVFLRDRKRGLALGLVTASALIVMYAVGMIKSRLLATPGLPSDPVTGLNEAIAMVLDPEIRLSLLRFGCFTGAMFTLALAVAAMRVISLFRRTTPFTWQDAVRSILALVAGSWYAWYVLLSIGWGRYGFPAFVLASPLVAAFLGRTYDVCLGRPRLAGHAPTRSLLRIAAGSFLLFCAFAIGRQAVIGVQSLSQPMPPSGVNDVAAFVNTATPAGTTVETYESELLFFLERPVHVPPAQLNVEFIRRNWLHGSALRSYDPVTVSADLLIVGVFGSGLYERLIADHRYVVVERFGIYTVYRRAAEGR